MFTELKGLADFLRIQLFIRAGLLLVLGIGLLSSEYLSAMTLTSVASMMLLADAALALLIHSGGAAEDHPALIWLTPVWQVNLAVTAAILLAQVFRPSRLATTVTVVMLAMTGGFWLMAFVLSRGSGRWAVLGWVSALYLAGLLVRMAPALASGSLKTLPVASAGMVALLLALWTLWWAWRSGILSPERG